MSIPSDVTNHIIYSCIIGSIVIVVIIWYIRRRREDQQQQSKMAEKSLLASTNGEPEEEAEGETSIQVTRDDEQNQVKKKWERAKKHIEKYSANTNMIMKSVTNIYVKLNFITAQELIIRNQTKGQSKGTSWSSLRESIAGATKMKEKYDKQLAKWNEKLRKIKHNGNLTVREQEKSKEQSDALYNEVSVELGKVINTCINLKDVGETLESAAASNQTLVDAAVSLANNTNKKKD